jgi:hypothetical protein
MKTLCFWLLAFAMLIPVKSEAQIEIPASVDYKDIERKISDPASPVYYPVLLDRYMNNDLHMTIEEYRYLYYGFTFHPGYQPYSMTIAEDSLNSMLLKDSLDQADLKVMQRLLYTNLREKPIALKPLLIMASVCEKLGDSKEAATWYSKYEKCLQAILSTGDGKSTSTAWDVIWINDEYMILNELGFEFTGPQQLIESSYDYLGVAENNLGVKGLYFNVNRLFEAGFKELNKQEIRRPRKWKRNKKS